MLFLLIRVFPFLLPVTYFILIKLMFVFHEQWLILASVFTGLLIFNFLLLKYKNQHKRDFLWLLSFAFIYGVTGWIYVLILESSWVINLFLLFWSLIYWLYLEAVFHEFYETERQYTFNLRNITLYGNILIIFFLTASLVNFNIFLNFSRWWLILILFFIYNILIFLAYLKQDLGRPVLVYSILGSLVLTQFLGALLFLPTSFYLISALVALFYYFFMMLTSLDFRGQLTKNNLIKIFVFFFLVLFILLFSAKWI